MASDPAKPLQFSLRAMFGVTALVAVVTAGWRWGGLAGSLIAVYLIAMAASLRWRRVNLFFALLVVGYVTAMLVPASLGPRTPSRRGQCMNNLRQIALALHQYHILYGSFPPAYIPDKDGRPMHSWRVLILPFLDERALYNAYRFDEPWDGPNNRKLQDWYGDIIFKCPADESPSRPSGMTSYVLVTGPGTMFGDGVAPRTVDILDGLSSTIMVVEVADSGINWMEPRDLHVAQMAPTINPKLGQGISSRHPGGAVVAFADGSVSIVRDDLSSERLRALLTANGGEEVSPDDWRPR